MNDFKHGDRVRIVKGGALAKIIRIFHAGRDGMPPTDLFVLERDVVDPMTGGRIETHFRMEIGRLE